MDLLCVREYVLSHTTQHQERVCVYSVLPHRTDECVLTSSFAHVCLLIQPRAVAVSLAGAGAPASTFRDALVRGDTMVAVDLSTRAADTSPARFPRAPRSPAAGRRYSVLLTKVAAEQTASSTKPASRALADAARIEYLC